MADSEEPELLSADEFEAIELCRALRAKLWDIFSSPDSDPRGQIVASGLLLPHVSAIEAYLKGQAASRAYPDLFRLLGESGDSLPTAPGP
jgi:hypothetical protein